MKMEAKNLRLGNLILNKKGEVEQVRTLYDKAINGYDGNAGIQPDDEDDFNPIPLTEEWIIKLGLEKESDSIYKIHGFTFIQDWQFVSYYQTHDFTGIQITADQIEYVHQFQNLFFAITGEELELEELSE